MTKTRLNDMLRSARNHLAEAEAVHLVMGNESADLDSMCSATLLAYLLGNVQPDTKEVVLPLINIPRTDFKLRRAAAYLLGEVGIDVGALLFVDDVRLMELHQAGRLRLVLVDHNELAEAQQSLADAVVEICDHHRDSGAFSHLERSKRVIEAVGSASTLVGLRILGAEPHLLDDPLATLLLGTILVDTANLDGNAGRATAKDRNLAEKLVRISTRDPSELFRVLEAKKKDISGLTSDELLRRDFKAWTWNGVRSGVASVPLTVRNWVEMDDRLGSVLAQFAEERTLNLLIVMGYYFEPTFGRQQMIVSADGDLVERVVAHLQAQGLDLRPIRGPRPGDGYRLASFDQANSRISRKKLRPLLEGLFRECDTP